MIAPISDPGSPKSATASTSGDVSRMPRIVCTALYQATFCPGARAPGQNVAWYNAVQTIRGILLTSPLVDAVADFGEPGSLMGAINAPYDLAGTYYETDNYHVRGPGQSELRPRSWAAITMAGAKG